MNKVFTMLTSDVKFYEENGYVETDMICSVGIDVDEYGVYESLKDFIEIESDIERSKKMYIYDLSFYGEYILQYLESSEWIYTKSRKMNPGEYAAIMSNGEIFQIRFMIDKEPSVYLNIYDIKKAVPSSNYDLNKGFGLEIKDYKYNNKDEDVRNMIKNAGEYAKLMSYVIGMNLNGVTLSSSAFSQLRKSVKNFDKMFPKTEVNEYDFIREGYFSGYNNVNNIWVGKELEGVTTLDVNSMFPSKMKNEILPFGKGVWQDGEIKSDWRYPLFIQRMKVKGFAVRYGKTPFVNLHTTGLYNNERYPSEHHGDIEITLPSTLIDLFFDTYTVYGLEYIGGYKYNGTKGAFDGFIDKWVDIKEKADKNGDKAMRSLSKYVLNMSYGSFGRRRTIDTTVIKDGERVSETVNVSNRYLPVAIFITSYAIKEIVELVCALEDDFVYADVDSIHFLGGDIPSTIEDKIDDSKLGMWSVEGVYDRSKFLKLKTYINENKKGLTVKTAGAGREVREQFTFDNFNYGTEFEGVVKAVKVKGGAIRKGFKYKL